jgi:hypothetical protein
MKSRLFKRLLFTVVLTAFGLVFIEGLCSTGMFLVELFRPERSSETGGSVVQYDPDLGWSSARSAFLPDMFGPGISVRTNAQGFRSNRERIPPSPPPGKLRVICSGDSFTFGYGVDNEHTWCSLLGAMEERFETVNMGQIGYGLDQSYLWYKRDGAPLEHQLHVVAFITADFERMGTDNFLGYGKPVLKLRDGALVAENVPVPRGRYAIPWWVAQKLKKLDELRSVQLLKSVFLRPAPRRGPDAESGQILELALRVIEDLDRLNRAKNSTLVLAYLPTNIDGGSEKSAFWRESIGKEAARRGWIFFDLVQDFRKGGHQRDKSLFRPEGHYTNQGNELVAKLLCERLRSLPQVAEKLSRP